MKAPSGVGKSTFAKALLGIDNSHGEYEVKGSLSFLDVRLNHVNYSCFGYADQKDLMHEELNAVDILSFETALKPKGTVPYQNLISLFDLELSQYTAVSCLSGGQRRRLNAARAMVGGAPIILFDEPTSGLDGATALELMRALQNISKRQRVSSVSIIHSPSYLQLKEVNKIMLLFRFPGIQDNFIAGRTVFFGSIEEFCPYFRRVFSSNSLGSIGIFLKSIIILIAIIITT